MTHEYTKIINYKTNIAADIYLNIVVCCQNHNSSSVLSSVNRVLAVKSSTEVLIHFGFFFF